MDANAAAAELASCKTGGLTVYAIGGSVTALGPRTYGCGPGGGCDADTGRDYCERAYSDLNEGVEAGRKAKGCKGLSYPQLLEDALNAHFPCRDAAAGSHRVVNRGVPGVMSDFWFDHLLSERSDKNSLLHQSQVVMLETSVNDRKAGGGSPYPELIIRCCSVRLCSDYCKARGLRPHLNLNACIHSLTATGLTHAMMPRLLRGLKHKPFILWVGASFGCSCGFAKPYDGPKPIEPESAEPLQQPTFLRYDVPYVSLPAALAPFDNLYGVSDPKQKVPDPFGHEVTRFFSQVFFKDATHANAFGHRLIASLVTSRLVNQLGVCTHQAQLGVGTSGAAFGAQQSGAEQAGWFAGSPGGPIHEAYRFRLPDRGIALSNTPLSLFAEVADDPDHNATEIDLRFDTSAAFADSAGAKALATARQQGLGLRGFAFGGDGGRGRPVHIPMLSGNGLRGGLGVSYSSITATWAREWNLRTSPTD